MVTNGLQKIPKIRSEKLKEWAGTQPCAINWDGCVLTGQSVWAHIPTGGNKGTSSKPDDILGTVACSNCHDVIDRRKEGLDMTFRRLLFWDGFQRSIIWAVRDGIIVVN